MGVDGLDKQALNDWRRLHYGPAGRTLLQGKVENDDLIAVLRDEAAELRTRTDCGQTYAPR
jgi:hypothetical protein